MNFTANMSWKLPNLRWYICGLIFIATLINYIDRQALAVVAPVIAREFSLNNEQTGRILSSFLFSYAIGQAFAGRLLDRVGTRIGFAVSVTFWSLANLLTAAVTRAWGFSLFRFLLGLGESGNFPGGTRVLREWFPASERVLAGGVFMSGASLGAVIAAPLVATITHAFGWRAAFIFTGSLGFFWVVLWLLVYQVPEKHRMLTTAERVLIQNRLAEALQTPRVRWLELFRFRQLWALIAARIFEEPMIWMLLFWLPKYIVDVRGLTVLQTGWAVTAPFIALDLGYLSGGWITRSLMRRGWAPQRARVTAMILGAGCMACMVPAAYAHSVSGFLTGISMATWGHGVWFTNLLAIPADIAPVDQVATVYGISAAGGALAGMLFIELTGIVADRFHSFTPILLVSGILPTLGTISLVAIGGSMPTIGLVNREAAERQPTSSY